MEVEMPIEKLCTDCDLMLSLGQYNKNNAYADGLHRYCRKCQAERYQVWTQKNPGVAAQKSRERRQKNPEKIREIERKWRIANSEQIRARAKIYMEKNKERIAIKNREWADSNAEKVREIKRKYAHSEKGKTRAKERAKIPAILEKDRLRSIGKGKKRVEALTDGYVAETIMVKLADVPIELIEFQRVRLQIKRIIREKK